MKDLALKNYTFPTNFKPKSVLELGGGNGDEAHWVYDNLSKDITMVDKKKTKNTLNDINFIEGDYFNPNIIESLSSYDLIISNFTLCFNSRENLEKFLPLYIWRINKGGIFYISDFNKHEQVVTKRTDLSDSWFQEIFEKFFDKVIIKNQEIFEPAHSHTHNIFEMVCVGKK